MKGDDKIVPVQEHELDQVFFNPCPDLLSSSGSNHSSWAPLELEHVTPPLRMILPLCQVTDDEMEDVDLNDVGSSSGPCTCSTHWSSDQENKSPELLREIPPVPLDLIDQAIVMHQDQVVHQVEALETKLWTRVSQNSQNTYQGHQSIGMALKKSYHPYLQVE